MLGEYKDKEFKSVSGGDLGLDNDEDKPEETEEDAGKDMFAAMKDYLADKITAVRSSKRLKSHPVCLANEGDLSIEMEKILSAMPNSQNIKASKVLEVNVKHDVYKALQEAYEQDQEKFQLYTDLLYNQALLIEGLPIEDPVEFTNKVCRMMK
jgi:molecular chaperone HtpG